MAKRYWLMKSEPDAFSLEHLKKSPKKTTSWTGVRNYQARNLMRDEIKVGDGVLFYHSNAQPPGVAGLARVVKESHPDPSQFDPKSDYYDPAAKMDAPRWFVVDIQYESTFTNFVSLQQLRETHGLDDMVLLRKGSRLSVQPVTAAEWKIVCELGE